MWTDPSGLEAVLRRDRTVVLAGLIGVTLLAWAYLIHLERGMGAGGMASDMMGPQVQSWGAVEILLLFVMWVVMMTAMMVPSVAPLVVMFARANRRRGEAGVIGSAGVLLIGYLLAWAGFSVLGTTAQWALHGAALLSPMMVSTSPVLGGVLLVSAGVFQLTPLKRACLAHCRSPVGFLMTRRRAGGWGALALGLEHGAYCVGCCWFLMALLFVAGVMNLLWVAAIATFVLIERTLRRGEWIGRLAGVGLILAGAGLVLG